MKSVQDRIDYLKKCAKLYETNGTSPITDDEYDKEYSALKELDPTNDFFSEVGGIEESVYGTRVKHKYIMGSLNKDPNTDEFAKWFEKTFGDKLDKLILVVELKVDGSSFCLKYQDGKFIQGVSRGDGVEGLDYTSNARFIKNVQEKISSQGYVEIKGEVFKNRQDFYKNWANQLINGRNPANPRNFTAGAINQKDPQETKRRGLEFIAYDVRGVDFKQEVEKSKFLEYNGFKTLRDETSLIVCKGKKVEDVIKEINKFMNQVKREDLPFDVDGIVVKINDLELVESMGTTDEGKRLKANRAIKFPTEKKETILEGVEWSIGRTGSLTPVALLKPVHIAGTTVQRSTIHNLKEMTRLGITNLGTKIVLEKAGDIIPKIIEVVEQGKGKKIEIPDTCPACEGELEWDDTETTKHCYNDACPAQVDRCIEHWFKKIGVLGIGPGIIEKLTSGEEKEGYIPLRNVADMYLLCNLSNIYQPDGPAVYNEIFGKKAFANIVQAVNSVKELSLADFIEALGIGKIGRMSKDITAIAPTIKDIDKLKVEDIVKIHGFKEKKANSFINGWKKQRDQIDRLLNSYITIKKDKETMSKKLNGKSFCITGTLSSSRSKFQEMIEENGGNFSSSVSSKLNYLICGEKCGSKMDKASALGVTCISEEEFMRMIK
jgi:DNA ligase (NAD+)